MPLIVKSIIFEGLKPREDVSPMYISVDNKYLSRQYCIPFGTTCWVEGVILEISRVSGILSNEERRVFEKYIIGKSVRFYLVQGFLIPYDHLYFDEDSWSLLRDSGIFPEEYSIRVKLSKLTIGEKAVNLYPYRDVIAG